MCSYLDQLKRPSSQPTQPFSTYVVRNSVASWPSAMSPSVHFFFIVFCTTGLVLIRANGPNKFATHRYHPTTFYSGQKDEPETAADDIQYAYEGGDSHTGEVTSHQDNDYQESSYQPVVQNNYQPVKQHSFQPDVQHEIHPDVQHDIHSNVQHDIHPDAQREFYPEMHDHRPEVQQDYKAANGLLDSGYQGISYVDGQDYTYHYGPDHDYHDLPPEYHYLTPPPDMPAMSTNHPMIETPKQTPQQYTYYYLGRHLWYIPLYFSIYFIIYVGALVLKSVARHKILFPYNLEMAAAQARTAKALEKASEKFYM